MANDGAFDIGGLFDASEVYYDDPKSGSGPRGSAIRRFGYRDISPKRASMELHKRLGRIAEQLKHPLVAEAGWWPDTDFYENGESVAKVARFQEHGGVAVAPNFDDRLAPRGSKLIHVPARPFVRPCLLAHGKKYARFAIRGMIRALRSGASFEPVMAKLALIVAGDIKKAIMEPLVYWRPLAQITIKRRKHLWTKYGDGNHAALEKQLVDTARMINSVEARSYAR